MSPLHGPEVKVYSCDYSTAHRAIGRGLLTLGASFNAYHNGEYTGAKFQCVELARRYWLINRGIVFESIPMAYHIFGLKSARRVADNAAVPLTQHRNGAGRPEKGSLLIWEPQGKFNHTGHVAVIVNVQDRYIDVAEQNVVDKVWPTGQNYSRRLAVEVDPGTGGSRILCSYRSTRIIGWVTIASGD
eukprot:GGOE01004892.1.p1 GENE.GGOE01004892.1~~GGOE01004892.1.p1  ORF type:complete len:187 (-),score=24.39 GGOE01004892.1:329-889(-)